MYGNFTTGPTFSALHSSIEILTISQAPKPNVGYPDTVFTKERLGLE